MKDLESLADHGKKQLGQGVVAMRARSAARGFRGLGRQGRRMAAPMQMRRIGDRKAISG
jgi:hypothetical protein